MDSGVPGTTKPKNTVTYNILHCFLYEIIAMFHFPAFLIIFPRFTALLLFSPKKNCIVFNIPDYHQVNEDGDEDFCAGRVRWQDGPQLALQGTHEGEAGRHLGPR